VNDVYLVEAPNAVPADVTLGEEQAVPPVVTGGGYRRRLVPPSPPRPAREPQAWAFEIGCEAHAEVAVSMEVRPYGRWLLEEILEFV
jgi:hypothetical protein